MNPGEAELARCSDELRSGALERHFRESEPPPVDAEKMEKLAMQFERLAVGTLMLLLMFTVLGGTALTAWSLIDGLSDVHELVAEPKALFNVFGLFVAVLIGIELLKILRHLLAAHVVNTALIVQTALIALCNKLITLDLHETSWLTLVAIAMLIIALAATTVALRLKGSSTTPFGESTT